MGRGIVESGLFRSERVQFELRTTDPAITKEGEAWVRTDLAPNTDQLATLRFDGGASTFDMPIFDSAATVTNVEKVWRVSIGGTVGFIPLAAAGESGAYPQVKYQHNGNALDGHDSLVVSAIPDSVVSRPNDDLSTETTQSAGAVVNFNSKFGQFGFNISNNTEGVTRARLFDYSQGTYVLSVDISNKSAGDPVIFEYSVVVGVDYGIELDANGGSYQSGFLSGSSGSTYTSQDVDIVSVSVDGSQSSTDAHQNVNDIGNTGL